MTKKTRARTRRGVPVDSWDEWHYDPDLMEAERAEPEFEEARERWLRQYHPTLAGRASQRRRFISYPCSGQRAVVFDEFDEKGTICAALLHGSARFGFGSVAESVATTTGRVVDDPWIISVTRALEGERVRAGWRRWLQVGSADREFVHVTAAVNRESIRRHGLDWRRMSVATGIAGSRGPELEGIFLAWDLDDARFFTCMARSPTDIWAVRTDGLWIENGPQGWWVVPHPIGVERLRLVETDIAVQRD